MSYQTQFCQKNPSLSSATSVNTQWIFLSLAIGLSLLRSHKKNTFVICLSYYVHLLPCGTCVRRNMDLSVGALTLWGFCSIYCGSDWLCTSLWQTHLSKLWIHVKSKYKKMNILKISEWCAQYGMTKFLYWCTQCCGNVRYAWGFRFKKKKT